MFGTKAAFKAYLDVVRPWAMGVDNRGWVHEDFFEHQSAPGVLTLAEGNIIEAPSGEWVAREDVKAYRTDPSHIIFPIVPYNITLLDRLFLGKRALAAALNLNQTIGSFNAALDAVNRADEIDTRWGRLVLLHTGLIGTAGGAGLFQKFLEAEESVR